MSYYEEAKKRAETLFKRELTDRELAEALAEHNCEMDETLSEYEEENTALKNELRRLSTSRGLDVLSESVLSESVLVELNEILSISSDETAVTITRDEMGYSLQYTISGSKDFSAEEDDD